MGTASSHSSTRLFSKTAAMGPSSHSRATAPAERYPYTGIPSSPTRRICGPITIAAKTIRYPRGRDLPEHIVLVFHETRVEFRQSNSEAMRLGSKQLHKHAMGLSDGGQRSIPYSMVVAWSSSMRTFTLKVQCPTAVCPKAVGQFVFAVNEGDAARAADTINTFVGMIMADCAAAEQLIRMAAKEQQWAANLELHKDELRLSPISSLPNVLKTLDDDESMNQGFKTSPLQRNCRGVTMQLPSPMELPSPSSPAGAAA